MLPQVLVVFASLATTALAQSPVNVLLCEARYRAAVTTCTLGFQFRECNDIEVFSACVCKSSGDRPIVEQCLQQLVDNISRLD